MKLNRITIGKTLFVFVLLLCTSFKEYNARMRLYFKNTGDETIYVAYGYHEWLKYPENKLESTYSGWHSIEPGQESYMFSINNEDDIASFAFVKRSGYIVYDIETNTNRKIGVDSIYVHPVKGFRYTDIAPSSFMPIKTSFKIQLETNGGDGTLNLTIEIPSYLTDKVIPMKAPNDGISNASKTKKTASDELKEIEASSSLAPMGTYKTKNGLNIEDDNGSINSYFCKSYIHKTGLTAKAGDLLHIYLTKTYPMRSESLNEPLEIFNEYE